MAPKAVRWLVGESPKSLEPKKKRKRLLSAADLVAAAVDTGGQENVSGFVDPTDDAFSCPFWSDAAAAASTL